MFSWRQVPQEEAEKQEQSARLQLRGVQIMQFVQCAIANVGVKWKTKKKKNLALELRRLPHFSSFPTEQPGQNHCQSVSQLGSQPGCRSCSCSSCCVANVDCILGAAAAAKQISAFSV